MTKARGEEIWTGFAGLTLVLGRSGTTVSATHSKQIGLESSFLDINKSLPLGRGVGYRLTASDVDGGTAGGQFEVNTGFNRMRVNYDATNGGDRQTGSATVSGGISATRAGLYLTRPLDQSVAVVEVEGLKDVHILVDNTPVGHTGGSGKLLINELLPYLANRISYEEADIPFDYKVPVSSQLVAPPYHGAAYVKFKTARIQARAGTVVLMIGGAPVVPSYGAIAVKLGEQEVESPLNEQGQFFLDLPIGRYTATVAFKGKSCDVEFEATTGPDLIQNVGTLTCTP
jgi:outer membrane usher protein